MRWRSTQFRGALRPSQGCGRRRSVRGCHSSHQTGSAACHPPSLPKPARIRAAKAQQRIATVWQCRAGVPVRSSAAHEPCTGSGGRRRLLPPLVCLQRQAERGCTRLFLCRSCSQPQGKRSQQDGPAAGGCGGSRCHQRGSDCSQEHASRAEAAGAGLPATQGGPKWWPVKQCGACCAPCNPAGRRRCASACCCSVLQPPCLTPAALHSTPHCRAALQSGRRAARCWCRTPTSIMCVEPRGQGWQAALAQIFLLVVWGGGADSLALTRTLVWCCRRRSCCRDRSDQTASGTCCTMTVRYPAAAGPTVVDELLSYCIWLLATTQHSITGAAPAATMPPNAPPRLEQQVQRVGGGERAGALGQDAAGAERGGGRQPTRRPGGPQGVGMGRQRRDGAGGEHNMAARA